MGRPKGSKNRVKIVDVTGQPTDIIGNRREVIAATEPAKTRAAAYIRVSTDEQAAHGTSLNNQKELIAARVVSKDWALVDVYEDAGYSGGKMDRPELTRLIADIKDGKIDAVVVYKLDRLSRKQKDTLILLEDVFEKHGVKIISIIEELDTSTATGRAMIGLLSVFAQLERDTIKERLTSGRKQTAKAGRYSGGAAPIGYTATRGDKALKVDTEKVATVKRVFELFDGGEMTFQAIADKLNEEGHTTKRGALFGASQIFRIVNRRDVYAGSYKYAGIEAEGQHKNILPKRKAA
jgi:site-specific DNA recombinase